MLKVSRILVAFTPPPPPPPPPQAQVQSIDDETDVHNGLGDKSQTQQMVEEDHENGSNYKKRKNDEAQEGKDVNSALSGDMQSNQATEGTQVGQQENNGRAIQGTDLQGLIWNLLQPMSSSGRYDRTAMLQLSMELMRSKDFNSNIKKTQRGNLEVQVTPKMKQDLINRATQLGQKKASRLIRASRLLRDLL